MRRLLGVAVLLAALGALGVAAAAADTGGSDRPFTAKLAGSATFLPDATCPIGLRTWTQGSGTASHLGLVSMSSNHCTPPADVITGGRMTLVAANGDEVHMTYRATCDQFPNLGEVFACNGENVIVGGTGRFANASGEARGPALVTFAGIGVPVWPITWSWDGAISY